MNYGEGQIRRPESSASITGGKTVGGAIGFSSGDVIDLLATGPVSGSSEVGGLIGRIICSVHDSCATGSVSISGSFAGGLIGYNHGYIYNSHVSGQISGGGYMGGLVGYNYRYYASEGLVSKCFSTGKVVGTSGGGLIGRKSGGSIVYSFWDTDTSGQTSSSGGIGKTTAQMKTRSTFTSAGWDFTDVWWIRENITYPLLFWQDYIQPKSNAGPDQSIDEDTVVRFDGGSSTDNLKIVNYTWSFNNRGRVVLYGKRCEDLFNNPGIFKVALKVTDPGENIDIDYLTVTANDTTPPRANAGEDLFVNEDTMISLNGTGSSDNYRISKYLWTFFDRSPVQLTGAKPTYTFNDPGVFDITLNVTDPAGHWDIDKFTVTVRDFTPPEANGGSDLIIRQGSAVIFNGTASIDNVGIVKYEWKFTYREEVTLNGPEPEYTFDHPDLINVTLNVTDVGSLG